MTFLFIEIESLFVCLSVCLAALVCAMKMSFVPRYIIIITLLSYLSSIYNKHGSNGTGFLEFFFASIYLLLCGIGLH